MHFKNNRWLWAAMLGLSLVTACKKEKAEEDATPPPAPEQPPAITLADRQKDTAFLYSREIYLWNEQIPGTFNARTYGTLDEVMKAIRQFSKEPGFNNPVDRWSFAVKQQEWDNISSGIAGDFGLTIFFKQDGDLRVRSVEPASPAGKAGIRRGWRITGLNGNTDMKVANANAIVKAVYQSTSTAFSFTKPDGTAANISLNAAEYQERPVYLDSVYTVAGKKIGYMVFNSFLGNQEQIFADFQRVFSRFTAAQVNDVVVDLRYNGGGYVSYQNKLAGYLLPQAANGGVLMKQEYNKLFSKDFNDTTYVKKEGSLNLPRLFVIVSDNTASASELLINNLKPYMDVKLVGFSDNTYGKPVGYFPIGIGDWYILPVSSRSTNKQGSGNYFNGFAVDSKVADGLDKDWGDLEESCLKQAVRYITTGSFNGTMKGRGKDQYIAPSPQVKQANNVIAEDEFRGMIDPQKGSLQQILKK
jgi:hypothetical protein